MIEHLAIATHQMPEWSGDKAGDEGRYKVFVTSTSAKRAGVSGEKNDPKNKRRAPQTAEPLTFH